MQLGSAPQAAVFVTRRRLHVTDMTLSDERNLGGCAPVGNPGRGRALVLPLDRLVLCVCGAEHQDRAGRRRAEQLRDGLLVESAFIVDADEIA